MVGGPSSPDRCPFAGLCLDNFLPSTYIRHLTTHPIHQAPTMFQALDQAHMEIGYDSIQVGSLPPTLMFDKRFGLRISCEEMDQQLSSLVQFITSVSPFICVVENLYIYGSQYTFKQWQDDTENSGWLEIFHPFAALKNLHDVLLPPCKSS